MIFIVGGAYQGKTDTACRLFGINRSDMVRGEDCEPAEALSAACVVGYHRLVARLMDMGADPIVFTEELCRKNSGAVIIMDEIGCGIVPIDKKERVYRENVGRCGCIIAENCHIMVRVVCGIPQYLKGGSL